MSALSILKDIICTGATIPIQAGVWVDLGCTHPLRAWWKVVLQVLSFPFVVVAGSRWLAPFTVALLALCQRVSQKLESTLLGGRDLVPTFAGHGSVFAVIPRLLAPATGSGCELLLIRKVGPLSIHRHVALLISDEEIVRPFATMPVRVPVVTGCRPNHYMYLL